MLARPSRIGALLLALLTFTACSCDDDPGGGGGLPDRGVVEDAGEDGGGGDAQGGDAQGGDAQGADAVADGGGTDTGGGDAGADPNNPNNPTLDTDCDGLSDAEEFSTVYGNGLKTDPNNPDTDGDGIPDGREVGRTAPIAGTTCPAFAPDADPASRTLPTAADTDGDGIADGLEDQNRNGALDANESSPTSRDSDGDQIPDALEDANRNGLRDAGELNPASRDSDGDGIGDGVEDADRDAMVDAGETNPLAADTDGDTLPDGAEDTNHDGVHQPYETDPRTSDTDCDGVSDAAELAQGTSPLVDDTDGDGITDGVELGASTTVPGSSCVPPPAFDQDPATMTMPLDIDSDGDGVPDGVEDSNHNGRRDPGELDPNNADSDGDLISDGDEILAGSNPLDPNDPNPNTGTGIRQVCADMNLKPVTFNVGGTDGWTLATELTTAYAAITVAGAANVDVGALDDATSAAAGFVLRQPYLGAGQPTSIDQNTAFLARLGAGAAVEGLSLVVRTAARHITSHDGYQTAVSGVVDLTVVAGQRNASELRNALLRLATGLGAASFTGLPTTTGAGATQYVLSYQLLVRTAPQRPEVLVVAAVLDRASYDLVSDNRSILLADLTNGTALARADARRGKDCDPFTAADQSVADFIWMADISGSTDDDRGRIVSAANIVFNSLASNNVNFRMGVVPHTENDLVQGAGQGGDLRGVGFTRDPTQFATYLQDTAGTDGCEFGLEAGRAAVSKALPRSAPGVEDPRKLRDAATLVMMYVTDEHAQEITEGQCGYDPGGAACSTGINDYYTGGDVNACTVQPNAAQQACINQVVNPFITQLQQNGGIAFAQLISPAAVPTVCTGYACPQPGSQAANEPGIGYVEVVNATNGTFYSPCVDNPGAALQSIIDAVAGAASQYQLTRPPISATIKVGITRLGMGGSGATDLIPRDKDNGFDYDAASNSIFFRGTTLRPNQGDLVIMSYRLWEPPLPPCGGPCPPGQICNPQLNICTCDQALCTANCGPTQTCDANCQCTCAPDCNGQCGPGQVCNTSTCACECAPDCGGACPAGTVCNPGTCACECDANCGGACQGTPLVCNTAACNCQCPADCGGQCGPGTVCNTSLCACACPPGCDQQCSGAATCDPANGCACACPTDCGGACGDGTICDSASCACVCPPDCTQTNGCRSREICDPNNRCGCVCPADCGGCAANETCDQANCRCVPIV